MVQISQEAEAQAKSMTMTIYRDKTTEAVNSSDSTDLSSSLAQNKEAALGQKQSTDTRATSTKPSATATGVTTRSVGSVVDGVHHD
jgi:hypothetical protein